MGIPTHSVGQGWEVPRDHHVLRPVLERTGGGDLGPDPGGACPDAAMAEGHQQHRDRARVRVLPILLDPEPAGLRRGGRGVGLRGAVRHAGPDQYPAVGHQQGHSGQRRPHAGHPRRPSDGEQGQHSEGQRERHLFQGGCQIPGTHRGEPEGRPGAAEGAEAGDAGHRRGDPRRPRYDVLEGLERCGPADAVHADAHGVGRPARPVRDGHGADPGWHAHGGQGDRGPEAR